MQQVERIETLGARARAERVGRVLPTTRWNTGTRHHLSVVAGIVALAIGGAILLGPWSAADAGGPPTLVVDTTDDSVDATPGDSVCADSVGACSLRAAIQEANANGINNAIMIPTGTYVLTRVGTGDANGDLDITTDLNLYGDGESNTVIVGVTGERVLHVRAAGARLGLQDLTVEGGDSSGVGGGVLAERLTELDLTSTTIEGNDAILGGGIFSFGSLELTGSTIFDNTAIRGAGVMALGGVTVNESSVTNNVASNRYGGIVASGIGGFSMHGSDVTANEAPEAAGITTTVATYIAGSTIADNAATVRGGGLTAMSPATVVLIDSNISGNTAGYLGAGILADSPLDIQNSRVTSNTAGSTGGGIVVLGAASTSISGSTIDSNAAGDVAGIGVIGGTLAITNSTISNNGTTGGGALGSGLGGGLFHASLATLDSVTITENTTQTGPAGIYTLGVGEHGSAGGTTTISNTIVADQTTGDDCGGLGAVTSNGYNLDTTGTCALTSTGDLADATSADLAPLAPSAPGSPPAHVPSPSSPVVDVGNTDLNTDVRGVPRPQGAGDDIGAVEVVGPLSLTVTATNDASDESPGDGVCKNSGEPDGTCSLRAAVDESNAWPRDGGANLITFATDPDDDIALTNFPFVDDEGGDLDITADVDIMGGGHVLLNDPMAAWDRVLEVHPGATASIDNVLIVGGSDFFGGLVVNSGDLSISRSALIFGDAGVGGAVYNAPYATLHLDATFMTLNQAMFGGAIVNEGSIDVINSTFGQNLADTGAAIFDIGTVDIVASTISENASLSGALYRGEADEAYPGNSAGSITLASSIVADQQDGPNCSTSGGITSLGYNIESGAECGLAEPTDLQNTSAELRPLFDLDENLPTMTPYPESPAVDAIPSGANGCGIAPLDVDQNGHPRPYDLTGTPNCDIGAAEALDPPLDLEVNSTTDAVDETPGDGVCASAAAECTLRAAVQESNAWPAADTIWIDEGSYPLTIIGADEDASATGDLDITDDMIISGEGAGVTVDGDAYTDDRILDVLGAQVDIEFVSLVDAGDGTADVDGGALRVDAASDLLFEDGTIGGNATLGTGGGIHNAGLLWLGEVVVDGNEAGGPGAGLANTGGELWIDRSTISDNVSDADDGGGVLLTGGTVEIFDSTISGNAGGAAGGIRVDGATVTADHVTITNNQGVAGVELYSGSLTMQGSIVANQNGTDDCLVSGAAIASDGYNLSSDTTCSFATPTDLADTDPMLLPLADNGGGTETHALPFTSPAIDAIPPGDIGCGDGFDEDQRQTVRPQEAGCDIGSYELELLSLDLAVDSTTDAVDAVPGDGVCASAAAECTLRAAVQETNAWPTDDTITLAGATTYPLTITGDGEDAAVTGDLDFTDKVVVDGADSTIDASALDDRVIELLADDLRLNSVTVTGGTTGPAEYGAGIKSSGGTLTLTTVTVEGNEADGSGGGLALSGTIQITDSTIQDNTADVTGGGIFNAGTLTMHGSAIVGNEGTLEGGGLANDAGSATLTNVTISGNTGTTIGGGVLVQEGTVTLVHATVTDNTAAGGAGIHVAASGTGDVTNSIVANQASGDDCSGTVASGGYNLESATGCGFPFTGDPGLAPLALNGGPTLNHLATGDGMDTIPDGVAGCGVAPLDIDQRGTSRPQLDGCDIGAVETFLAPLSLAVDSTTDAVDSSPGDGVCATGAAECTLRAAVQESNAWPTLDTISLGADETYVLALTGAGEDQSATGDIDVLDDVTIEGNGASVDGNAQTEDRVLEITNAGTVTILDIELTNGGDLAGIANGGALSVQGSSDVELIRSMVTDSATWGYGGGIYNAATLTLIDSTVSGNTGGGNLGAGIMNTATLDIRGSTLSGNIMMFGSGGGLLNFGTLTMTNSTVSGNQSANGAAGVHNAGSATLTNVTVTANTSLDGSGAIEGQVGVTLVNSIVADQAAGPDCSQGITSGGYNLESGTSCGFTGTGDQQSVSPTLGALAANGGPTTTHLPGALATDVIPAGTNGCGTTPLDADQRHYPRPADGACEVGSVEIPSATLDLTVDSGADDVDEIIGNGACETAAGECTLRAAIQESNASTGADVITVGSCICGDIVLSTTDPGGDEDLAATGDLDITGDLTIVGNGKTVTGAATPYGRIFEVLNGTVDVSDLTISRGRADTEDGAGIYVAAGTSTLTDVTLDENYAAGLGGAAYVASGAALELVDSDVTGNLALAGGGIASMGTLSVTGTDIDNNVAQGGGGILAEGGTLTIDSSTISNNQASGTSGAYTSSGAILSEVSTTMINATVTGNSALLAVGGVRLAGGGTVTHSTITSNSGIGLLGVLNGISVDNTIIAGNGANCHELAGDSITSGGHNLESGSTCAFAGTGDLQNTNPVLEALADNGGPTLTRLPGTGSLAIDGGASTVSADQRGIGRPQGTSPDIGAVEVESTGAPT